MCVCVAIAQTMLVCFWTSNKTTVRRAVRRAMTRVPGDTSKGRGCAGGSRYVSPTTPAMAVSLPPVAILIKTTAALPTLTLLQPNS